MKVIFEQSPNFSGNMGAKSVIVIHWWGNPADKPSLSGTVNWLCNPAAKVSAHYIVSGTTVYQLVNEEHVAWHAMQANAFSIGIEVDPNTPPGTYETVIQLCREIADRHGMNRSSCIKRHKDYVNTQCPGTLDIERIRAGVLNQPAQGGADDMTIDQVFDNCFITVAQRWPNDKERSDWKKSGLEPYTWVQRNAPNNLPIDHPALRIYQEAREKLGSKYPGGANQFAIDRILGGDSFASVMERDMSYYLNRSSLAEELLNRETPAPLTPQDQKDLELGRKFRSVAKEANA